MAPATEALLFAASRAQLIAETVRPALARDATVLLDRFLLSTYAYQGAGRGLPLPALRAINGTATGGLTPDLTLLLTMPLDDAILRIQSRGARDRIDGEEQGFHARVHRAFADACDPAWQAAHPEIGPVAAVDATGTEDAVTARCLGELRRRWPARFDALVESTHG
jgi:dTMP kinase